MPGLPCDAEIAETTISGAEVPKPTITMPINSGGMPKWRAVAAEPSTKRSALQTRSARPKTMARKAVVIKLQLLFFQYSVFNLNKYTNLELVCLT
jgi:hypothetical protein